MKRFGDVLRILSSVLVGSVIKDFDDLRKGLSKWFADERVGWLAGVLLIALFVRNIHGSAQYDDWIGQKGFTPSFERKLWGRYLAFGLSIAALFLGPFLPSHLFVKDFANGQFQPMWGIVFLFLSPAVYLVWDIFLYFFSEPDSTTKGDLRMHDVALRWFKIDLWAIVFTVVPLSYFGIAKGGIPPVVIGLDFIFVASLIIFFDYIYNNLLYFPPPRA